ncbi:MAG: glutathione reductase (NADPH) [Kiritimatiellia bacterium]|jgi:glutathione reductase (NADPH)
MPVYDFDLVVLGAGSGGVRCARMSAAAGARVAIIEADRLGGTCVNVGCVPKKLYMYGARYAASLQDSRGYGWSRTSMTLDWAAMHDAVLAEVTRLNGIYGRLLEGPGCEIVRGWGTVDDAHTVRVGDRTLTAERILIATGSWPHIPPVDGNEHIITSNEFFALREQPKQAVILGGGYIAVELASILAGAGTEVHLIVRRDKVLTEFDEDVRSHVTEQMAGGGVHMVMESTAVKIEAIGSRRRTTMADGRVIDSDLVLAATGRHARSRGLGLEELGVHLNKNHTIQVDDEYQTDVPGIYAVGDVIGRAYLTPVALAEGMYLARSWFTPELAVPVEYDYIPTAVFCRPHVGTVGLTEKDARAKGYELQIYKSTFRPMNATIAGRDERYLMKLVVDAKTDRVIGLHMVGDHAGEVLQGFAVAMKCGATKRDLDRTIGIHPTSAEELVTMRTPSS